MAENEKAKFSLSGENYTLILTELTTSSIEIEIDSQTITFNTGQEKEIDLGSDGTLDLSIKLKSINTETNKSSIILKPLSATVPAQEKEQTSPITGDVVSEGGEESGDTVIQKKSRLIWYNYPHISTQHHKQGNSLYDTSVYSLSLSLNLPANRRTWDSSDTTLCLFS